MLMSILIKMETLENRNIEIETKKVTKNNNLDKQSDQAKM